MVWTTRLGLGLAFAALVTTTRPSLLAGQVPGRASLSIGGQFGRGSGPSPSKFYGGSLTFFGPAGWSLDAHVYHVRQGIGVLCSCRIHERVSGGVV